ncbi:hypothetical protein MJN76_31915, partial [Salmonella enterica subsp. enterica serovar Anatum]|nr:hypothetical protein [Salmonella enterica subsp. enterica serovar Anatum]
FTADPAKDPSATMYDQLTYSEVLDKELKVMDLAAFTLARDHKRTESLLKARLRGKLRITLCIIQVPVNYGYHPKKLRAPGKRLS